MIRTLLFSVSYLLIGVLLYEMIFRGVKWSIASRNVAPFLTIVFWPIWLATIIIALMIGIFLIIVKALNERINK